MRSVPLFWLWLVSSSEFAHSYLFKDHDSHRSPSRHHNHIVTRDLEWARLPICTADESYPRAPLLPAPGAAAWKPEKCPTYGAKRMVYFTCEGSRASCRRVTNALLTVGDDLSRLLALKHPLLVRVQLMSTYQSRRDGGTELRLASGASTREIVLCDDDDIARLYPQAAVKQWDLPVPPDFLQQDVHLMLNMQAPFAFRSDQMTPDRYDLRYVVLHELLHGLGFTSAWRVYNSNGASHGAGPRVTPRWFIERLPNDDVVMRGLFENEYDRFLRHKTINMWEFGAMEQHEFPSGPHLSEYEMEEAFAHSFAANISSIVGAFCERPGTVRMYDPADPSVSLFDAETGLHPFRSGSSLSHVSATGADANKTSLDFLMRYDLHPGASLASQMAQVEADMPVGPGIRRLLTALGYRVREPQCAMAPMSRGEATRLVTFVHSSCGNFELSWTVFAPFVLASAIWLM